MLMKTVLRRASSTLFNLSSITSTRTSFHVIPKVKNGIQTGYTPPPTTLLHAITNNINNDIKKSAHITSLARYAVKGLGPSPLTSLYIRNPGETFPDDRRFALIKRTHRDKFNESNAQWIHKEHFVCAFTEPELLATLDTEYCIHVSSCSSSGSSLSIAEPWDCVDMEKKDDEKTKRLLTLWKTQIISSSGGADVSSDADADGGVGGVPGGSSIRQRIAGQGPILGPIDLSTEEGRSKVSSFFSNFSGQDVHCITASSSSSSKQPQQQQQQQHVHQFGNTKSGVRARNGDTRTIHIINAATVRELSRTIGIHLDPMRFRPNIVVDNLEPWTEFDWVNRTLTILPSSSSLSENENCMELDVISRTVRCAGVGVDPKNPDAGVLDIPELLTKHYPEHGPFLGVYAVVRVGGRLSLGDSMKLKTAALP